MAEGIRWTKVAYDTVQRGQNSQHTPETISVEGGGKGDRKMPDLHYRKVDVAGHSSESNEGVPVMKIRSRNKGRK